ncbi:MAG: RluA family pseudouridine synthase [Pirellulales bacterium]|nr:RluA family pseudouridine synthase [Pirellulales bacterium]
MTDDSSGTAGDELLSASGEGPAARSAAAPQRFEVSGKEAPCRLDVFLSARIRSASRAAIRRAIDTGSARVADQVRKASYKLIAGQIVEFCPPPTRPVGPEPEPISICLLYEDEAIAVVDKPAGMVVHPAKGHWSGTLASALMYHFERLSQSGGPSRPGIVHRLDRDTSGVLVVAKTDEAHWKIAEQFKERSVEKQYVAIVAGRPDCDRDWIDFPIGDHPKHRERKALRADHPSSRAAQTFFEVEERCGPFSVVRAFPKTGRTHQIRLHLAHIGCPVLCDRLYGGTARLTAGQLRSLMRIQDLAGERSGDEVLLDRQALHAHRLCLKHPFTGKPLEFTAPIPDDMRQLLLILQQISQ